MTSDVQCTMYDTRYSMIHDCVTIDDTRIFEVSWLCDTGETSKCQQRSPFTFTLLSSVPFILHPTNENVNHESINNLLLDYIYA